MKNQTNTNLVIGSSLVLALALAICSPVNAQSPEPAQGNSMMKSTMMERCQEMKQQKQKMMEDIRAQDDQLAGELAEMNRAPEDKKMGLMAGVLTHLVEQRTTMNARKAKMDEEMMQHMMQHMQMGKGAKSQCPMMQGMKGMAETPAGAQK